MEDKAAAAKAVAAAAKAATTKGKKKVWTRCEKVQEGVWKDEQIEQDWSQT